MNPEETALMNAANDRANNAERDLAIANAITGQRWITPDDARAALTGRASRDEAGALRFASENKDKEGNAVYISAEAAAKELATSRKHWIAAEIKPATGATGAGQGTRPAGDATTYAELLKPQNADQLVKMMDAEPERLARLRDAHFTV